MNGNLRGILTLALLATGCGAGGGSAGGSDAAGGSGETQEDMGVGGSGGQVVGGQVTAGTTGGETGGTTGGDTGGTTGGDTGGTTGGTTGGDIGGSGGGGDIGGSGGGGDIGGSGGGGDIGGGGGGGDIGGSGGGGGIGGGGGEIGGAIVPPDLECGAVSLNDSALEDGSFVLDGSTAGAAATFEGDCGGATGPDAIFGFTAPVAGTWIFTTRGPDPELTFDSVLYARTTCDDSESELACNDDDASAGFSTQSLVSLELGRGDTIYLIVDGYSADASGDFQLSGFQQAQLGDGEPCDPASLNSVCGGETSCLDQDEDGSYVCVDPNFLPPEVCGPATNLNDSGLEDGSFAFAGDTTGDANEHRGTCGGRDAADNLFIFTAPADGEWTFTTKQADPEATFDTVLYARSICDDPNSQPESGCSDDSNGVQSSLSLALAMGDEITLVVDGYGEGSGPYVLSAYQVISLGEGDACVAGDLRAVCGLDLACIDADGDGNSACALPLPPVLDSVTAFYNPDNGVLAVQALGTDPDLDVTDLAFTLFDSLGAEVPLGFFGGEVEVAFNTIDRDGDHFVGTLVVFIDVPDVASGTFAAVDDFGLRSDLIETDIGTPPVVGEGGACDVGAAFALCDANLACDVQLVGAQEGVCAVPAVACGGSLGATLLVANPETGEATASGSLAIVRDQIQGSCSAEGAGENAYTFVAAAEGTYVLEFTSEDEEANFIVVARSHCEIEDFRYESACGAVTPGGARSFSIPMALGETISLFVEGAGGEAPWAGDYTVTARLAHAPTVDTVLAVYNAANTALGIEATGSDVDNDIIGLAVVVTDPEGNVLIGNADGSPIVVDAFDSLVFNEDGTVTARFSGETGFDPAAQIGEVRVGLADASGLVSELLLAELGGPAALEAGAACDEFDAFTACGDGLLCIFDEETFEATCQ